MKRSCAHPHPHTAAIQRTSCIPLARPPPSLLLSSPLLSSPPRVCEPASSLHQRRNNRRETMRSEAMEAQKD
ncbi:hypothetical protein CesoFtcFv8_010849 [Champsocephalus esox]|uniref:Uncharacterized protein n=1 Tax=Champsocephalus esox TaxID=159716 RepID=A0AAN8GXG2_9TELE|nr:hypothetical protein CesoFtcFv8_010849 [Champsocephalus esox]